MEALRIAHQIGIRLLAAVRSRAFLWPWLTNSWKLVLGTLAYNAFVFLFVKPILRAWFPPLKPWEHVTGVFSGTRTTYEDLLPTVATILWIAGNALVVTLLRDGRNKPPVGAADRPVVS